MAELVCSSWTNKFFVILLLSKTPPPSARSPRRWPLRHDHRSRCHQTVLPLQLRLPERNHQKTDDYQSVRRDQRVSRILNYRIFTWSCFYKSSVIKKDRTTVLAASGVSEFSSGLGVGHIQCLVSLSPIFS